MKINHPLVKGTVKEVLPNVHCVIVDDDYDRAMLFCRYQEFYESPYKQFRGKYFTWAQYMRHYKIDRKEKVFTYPFDWLGYNIPSHILEGGLDTFYKETEYDEIMNDIYYHCENYPLRFEKPRTDWYLIGASSKNLRTMNHEIAHGLYYTNKEYKKLVDNLVKEIKPSHYSKIKKVLLKIGYANDKKIIDDEIQAFMSTGLYEGLNTKELKVYEKAFVNNFKKYKK